MWKNIGNEGIFKTNPTIKKFKNIRSWIVLKSYTRNKTWKSRSGRYGFKWDRKKLIYINNFFINFNLKVII